MESPIKFGISACLTGQKVRYDGGHTHDRFLTDTLGKYVAFVPVCPEAECGLGVPREAMRLFGNAENPRLLTIRTKQDHTDRMVLWAKSRMAELEKEELCAFIFKSGSPSSGMERVKVYDENGMPQKKGIGIFARIFMARFPSVPAADEKRLYDPVFRENFIESVFVFRRWRKFLSEAGNIGALVDFHTRHKLLVLSHSTTLYREMGKLVAEAKTFSMDDLFNRYQRLLSEALRLRATPAKNTNALEHAMGYFKKQLSADEKRELLELFDQYRTGNLPLIVPLTLLNHYVRKYGQAYLKTQYWLNPHPLELLLKNHA